MNTAKEYITLDGNSLTTSALLQLGKGEYLLKISDDALERVRKSRDLLNDIVAKNQVAYGVTTGFGNFARTIIPPNQLAELQENLIRSHSAGVGESITLERIRMLLALRINVLVKGYSGISLENLKKYVDAFNNSLLPWVPEKGTVGASGDLAPLAHLALGMMGEGKMWSPKTGWAEAKDVLKTYNLQPIKLGPKEGLALINGAQFITALGSEALERAEAITRQADIVAAVSFEALKGTTKAYDEDIHKARPHLGQIKVASRLRSILHSDLYPSQITESELANNKVQDAYTLRCIPQVHGVVNDTNAFVRTLLATELNSAGDNPMVFADRGEIISGGNFHGEYPAKANDYLAIGVHELANISERRIERLVNKPLGNLPPFLTENGGLNSGFMIAHCTAAALVSENKVLCHPASVDSQTTSAGTEDHVSMGGFAARKALNVVENVEQVLAIELLAACQGLEFLKPLKPTKPIEEVYKLVRSVVAPWDRDRYMAPDINAATKLLKEEKVWNTVKPYMDKYESSHPQNTSA
ncbi:histidine ammonia-lyase [Octopus bimaculoides]|uniref:Histidine ammonia-lyase n=1 Tax=Octopus bimaculoides TaxID=37653 RepID=A0A0L8IE74_OCTBM|nr:histidine ammonia-lyase [Octopus bimaculoides]